MMYRNRLISAIDIGTTKIVAVIGQRDDDGRFRILGLGKAPSRGVKRGNVLNIDDTVRSIREAAEKAQAQAQLPMTDVFVGIAGQNIKCLRNSGYINRASYHDEITQDDVDKLINDQYLVGIEPGEEIIHVLPQNFTVDGESGVRNPVGNFGKRLEGNFHIVIGKTMNINNLKKCISRSDLKLNRLILEPLASSYAVLTDDEKEAGVALVDIGGGTTDLAVYFEGQICHTAVIPFGGNVITSDVKAAYNILERYAEDLKVNYGSALAEMASDNEFVSVPGVSGRDPKEISVKHLAHIIQARMEEIIGALQFQIDNSGYASRLGAGIVVTGGGAQLKNLTQLFSFHTGYDIRIGYPIQHLSSEVEPEINQTMFATSIGLALIGEEEKAKMPEDDFFTSTFTTQEAEIPPVVDEMPVQEVIDEVEEEEDDEEETNRGSKRGSLLDKLGRLFEDRDSKL